MRRITCNKANQNHADQGDWTRVVRRTWAKMARLMRTPTSRTRIKRARTSGCNIRRTKNRAKRTKTT